MKKTILILFSSLFFTSLLSAQDDKKLALKTGINISNIAGDHTGNGNSSLIGFNFGFSAELPQTENFSFQPEIVISQQGYKLKNERDDVTVKNFYVNIPVIFKCYIPEIEGFSIQAGPQMGYLISSNIKGNLDGISVDQDAKDIHEDIDFTLAMGLALETKRMNFNIRYNMGLTSIFDTPGGSNREIKAKNSVFQFSVGVPIN